MPAAAPSRVPLALGLVTAAGLSTVAGALVVFCVRVPPNGLHSAKAVDAAASRAIQRIRTLLAASLAFSAGVMLYVSFCEIFTAKAVESFATYAGATRALSEEEAAAIGLQHATYSFFGGVLIMTLVDTSMHALLRCRERIQDDKQPRVTATSSDGSNADAGPSAGGAETELTALPTGNQATTAGDPVASASDSSIQIDGDAEDAALATHGDRRQLHASGLLTALAIAVHNFPEGLATFVATMADASAGATLAIAIAIHNVPEGVCVAMPIYAATGSRCKAIGYALLSGLTEPLGALVGWLALDSAGMSDVAYGAMFGLVAGMMVYISIKELLPTALKYASDDDAQAPHRRRHPRCLVNCSGRGLVAVAAFLGMAVMAMSLLLFTASISSSYRTFHDDGDGA